MTLGSGAMNITKHKGALGNSILYKTNRCIKIVAYINSNYEGHMMTRGLSLAFTSKWVVTLSHGKIRNKIWWLCQVVK